MMMLRNVCLMQAKNKMNNLLKRTREGGREDVKINTRKKLTKEMKSKMIVPPNPTRLHKILGKTKLIKMRSIIRLKKTNKV